jgi:perosamine synthetase
LVDIEWESMNIDPKLAAAAMTERTRAMIPVHIFGRPCALNALEAVCQAHDIVMFEDACEALGAEFQGRKVGGFGTAGVFGFYPNKQITTGEGGLITTNDMAFAAKLRSLRNQGRDEMGTWLFHEHLGFNYRLDEMSAALGLSQLKRIDTLLERRRKAAATYAALLAELDGVTLRRIARRAQAGLFWSYAWTSAFPAMVSSTICRATEFPRGPTFRPFTFSPT